MSNVTIPQHLAEAAVAPEAYQDGKAVDDAFREMRAHHPFAQGQPQGYDPIWFATKHADVLGIEMRPQDFQNSPRSSTVTNIENQMKVKFITGGDANLIRSLVQVDGEEHKALRGVVFPSMTPKAVKTMEENVRLIAKDYVQRMLDSAPECDFSSDIAFWYPLRVIMRVLGVPEEDEPYLLRLTQELFSAGDPELNRDRKELDPAQILQSLIQTNADLEAYFLKVTEKFRAAPDDSKVNSLIANATIDGEYLNHRQLMGYYIIAATAGHDTTSNTVAGGGWVLAEQPDLLRRLQNDPSQMGAFVEETVRWVTPVKHFMRTAVRDTEFNGHAIKKDDYIMLAYQSANRDEDAFEDPYTFNIDRKPNKQVAFGYGPHVCLGQHLARLEMRILWEELLPHIRTLELTAPPQLTRSNFVCGPKHVPVRFTLN
jgi:hypothetical protein